MPDRVDFSVFDASLGAGIRLGEEEGGGEIALGLSGHPPHFNYTVSGATDVESRYLLVLGVGPSLPLGSGRRLDLSGLFGFGGGGNFVLQAGGEASFHAGSNQRWGAEYFAAFTHSWPEGQVEQNALTVGVRLTFSLLRASELHPPAVHGRESREEIPLSLPPAYFVGAGLDYRRGWQVFDRVMADPLNARLNLTLRDLPPWFEFLIPELAAAPVSGQGGEDIERLAASLADFRRQASILVARLKRGETTPFETLRGLLDYLKIRFPQAMISQKMEQEFLYRMLSVAIPNPWERFVREGMELPTAFRHAIADRRAVSIVTNFIEDLPVAGVSEIADHLTTDPAPLVSFLEGESKDRCGEPASGCFSADNRTSYISFAVWNPVEILAVSVHERFHEAAEIGHQIRHRIHGTDSIVRDAGNGQHLEAEVIPAWLREAMTELLTREALASNDISVIVPGAYEGGAAALKELLQSERFPGLRQAFLDAFFHGELDRLRAVLPREIYLGLMRDYGKNTYEPLQWARSLNLTRHPGE